MRRALFCAVTAASFALAPFMMGCEDTVSKHEEKSVKSDGTVVKKEEKVTRNADGSLNKTQSVDVDKPSNDTNKDVHIKVDSK
jgi:hypothetical protein